MAKYYRNQGIGNRIREGKRLEYGKNRNNEERRMIEGGNGQGQNNLNGDGDLIVFN